MLFNQHDFSVSRLLCVYQRWSSFKICRNMASHMWTLPLALLLMVSATMGAAPRRPVAVPFGRNYMPTWAFDHIKYFNGGSEIQLHLDKYTGILYTVSGHSPLVWRKVFFFFFKCECLLVEWFDFGKALVSSRKDRTCLATSVCK